MTRRDWRTDNMRLEGPYGIPAQYLTDDEKAKIDRGFARKGPGDPIRVLLDRHTPEVADGPFIASCSCGWKPDAIASGSDGGKEWARHVVYAR